MRRLTHLLVLAAFIFSCGGHWYVLQGIAWVNMVREYSQFVSVPEAVSMTLSGQYPCAICKAIAEKKAAERNQICAMEKYAKKFSPPASVAAGDLPALRLDYLLFTEYFQVRPETPPTPPPRFALS